MKTDDEVKLLLRERQRGRTQEQSAARAGMSVRTARKYENGGKLPSALKKPRSYKTRPDPFEQDWAWVQARLHQDSALQAKTLFEALCEEHPGRYEAGQLRTLQRRIERWRALFGPDQEVMFEQVHRPGRMAQTDFTSMNELAVTIAGQPFPHLVFHLVLTYSNVEAVKVCFSESFEALAEGIEHCLWQIGGVPEEHRTDNLSAAVRHLIKNEDEEERFTEDYLALMRHYGMVPTSNNPGKAHENGDVEQSHYRYRNAVDQALRLRGSRDFESRAAYEAFLFEIARRRNSTRQTKFAEERTVLRPLPAKPLGISKHFTVTVSRFSTIRALRNTYSVPSRLIGCTLTVWVHAEELELHLGSNPVMRLPRLRGRHQKRIDYRHVIWSLVRKPGAFAAYQHRDEMFPSTVFRRAYDALKNRLGNPGDLAYLRILHLAASTSEVDVEAALELLFESRTPVDFDTVKALVTVAPGTIVPQVSPLARNLTRYDALLPGRCGHG